MVAESLPPSARGWHSVTEQGRGDGPAALLSLTVAVLCTPWMNARAQMFTNPCRVASSGGACVWGGG